MKKLISTAIIAVLAVGVTFAQGIQDERNQANNTPRVERQRAPQQQLQREKREPRKVETVTVNGPLKLERGIVAIQSGEKTHFIPMLNRYIGFISGLQEGKTVSVEGFAGRNMLHPQKLTIDGKEYEFGRAMFAQGMPRQQVAPRLGREPFGTRHAPNCYVPHQRFHAPRRGYEHNRENAPRRGGERNREDRPNRKDRTRRNAPTSTSSLQSDAV